MKKTLVGSLTLASLLTGCSASTGVVGTTVLPTSNKSIDVVLHRSDVKFLDCATLVVIQTYSNGGDLIDSAKAQGRALHCEVIQAGIQAAGTTGAGALVGHGLSKSGSVTNIKNSNTQQQGQGQLQWQNGSVVSTNNNTANGGAGGAGGAGGNGGNGGNGGGAGGAGGQGNNGGGNGTGDGTNPGTGNGGGHSGDDS